MKWNHHQINFPCTSTDVNCSLHFSQTISKTKLFSCSYLDERSKSELNLVKSVACIIMPFSIIIHNLQGWRRVLSVFRCFVNVIEIWRHCLWVYNCNCSSASTCLTKIDYLIWFITKGKVLISEYTNATQQSYLNTFTTLIYTDIEKRKKHQRQTDLFSSYMLVLIAGQK